MKKKLFIFLLLAVMVVAAAYLLLWLKPGQKATEATVSQVVGQPAEARERPSIEAFGLVKATKVMNININFPARVQRLFVREGEKVTWGQPLLELDLEEYRAEIRKTEYDLLLARYELKKTETEIAQLTAKIAKKEEELAQESAYELCQIRFDLSKARQDLETKKELQKLKAISAEEVASLEKTVVDLMRSYEHLRKEQEEEIKNLKTELALKQKSSNSNSRSELTGLNMQKEQITLLEAKLQMLQKKLDQSFIRDNELISTLKNGVVSEVACAEGDLLTAERQVLSVIDLDSLIVKANVAEEFIKEAHLGVEVIITPVADYSRSYRGKMIRRADLAVKENGETVIPVEISIEDRDDFLLPNFNVDLKIYIVEPDQLSALMTP